MPERLRRLSKRHAGVSGRFQLPVFFQVWRLADHISTWKAILRLRPYRIGGASRQQWLLRSYDPFPMGYQCRVPHRDRRRRNGRWFVWILPNLVPRVGAYIRRVKRQARQRAHALVCATQNRGISAFVPSLWCYRTVTLVVRQCVFGCSWMTRRERSQD